MGFFSNNVFDRRQETVPAAMHSAVERNPGLGCLRILYPLSRRGVTTRHLTLTLALSSSSAALLSSSHRAENERHHPRALSSSFLLSFSFIITGPYPRGNPSAPYFPLRRFQRRVFRVRFTSHERC